MKDIAFLGTSLDDIRDFPDDIRQDTGYQLHLVQIGGMPNDFKYMNTIGSGVVEIRLKDADGVYHTVYVLHAFTKKTQKTPQADLNLAKSRLKTLIQQLKDNTDDDL